MRTRIRLVPLALVLAAFLAGCGQKAAEQAPPAEPPPTPFHVTGVQLGKAVRPDMTVESTSTTFGTRDTIYASVASEGSSSGVVLRARWSFQDGTQVNEASQTIAPTGPSFTEFHVSMEKPWPKGRYMVEIWADTTAVDTLEYEVQ